MNPMERVRPYTLFFWLLITFMVLLGGKVALAENIDPYDDGSQYAYGENVGWLNAEPLGDGGPGVQVSHSGLTGYIWAENIGWINLSPTYGGVVNDGMGNLSGYAWGENVGWINFAPISGGVIIDADGNFDGWAWGENIGWIHFQNLSVPYKVQTSWTPFIPTFPEPVDDLVDTSVGGTRYDRGTGQYSCSVTVTNTSATVISSPVWLVIESISNASVALVDPDGFTTEGKPYVDISDLLADGQLSPGESMVERIYFSNPSRLRFAFELSVYGVTGH